MAEGGSQMQEPLKALSELELLVQACQEDVSKAISKARLAVLRAGGVKAVSLGESRPTSPVTPRSPRSGKTGSAAGPGSKVLAGQVEKSQQPSLRGDESIPLYRSQDDNFEYPYTTDAFCNSLDVKSVKSMAVPSLKSPTLSVQDEKSPRTPKSIAPSSMETTLPCAPVNSNVGEERRTSKGSMTGTVPSEHPMSQHLHREKLDTIIGVVVLLNSLTMVMELECEGQIAGEKVGFREQLHCHQNVFFIIAEHVFTIIFVAELAWRVYWLRWRYFREVLNIVDAFLALYSFIYVYVLMVLLQSVNLQLLRLLRLAKLVRAIRIMRTLRLFRGLRLLVHACASFLPSLMWSMALLSLCIMTSGLVIGNLLHEFIMDETKEMEQRIWVWMHYGTAYRAIWTMYEMTFAGNWPVSARPVLENVNHGYCMFFALYVTVIVFAVLRVIRVGHAPGARRHCRKVFPVMFCLLELTPPRICIMWRWLARLRWWRASSCCGSPAQHLAKFLLLLFLLLMRVITAIFLKETLDAAGEDHEVVTAEKEANKRKYMRKLERIFCDIDVSGDGLISEEEFTNMLQDEQVKKYLAGLEVDLNESSSLFQMMADEDGQVSYSRFMDGMNRAKGLAKAADILCIRHDLGMLRKDLKLVKALSAQGLSEEELGACYAVSRVNTSKPLKSKSMSPKYF